MTQPVISNSYVGDGTTVLYSFTFPYINVADVVVSIDGTVKSSTTEYSFANATTIQFTTAPATSAAILIKRVTSAQDVAAVFFPGSAVRARDLNDNFVQGLYVSQESTATAAASSVEAQAASANAASAATAATSSAADAATTLTQANAAAASAATAQAASATAQTQANNASAAAATAAADATAAQASSATAIATANASSAASTQAVSDSAAAVVTSNNAAALVATANTNSNAAVVTANQSATDATSAVNIASSAQSLATQAQSDASAAQVAASAAQTASANAVTVSNQSASDAATAVSDSAAAVVTSNAANATAATSNTNSTQALNTANTSLANSASALTASATATTDSAAAVTTANNASATATSAANAVASAVFYTPIGNFAAFPANPSNTDRIEVSDSTGLESQSIITGIPSGFTGSSDLTMRLEYNSTTSKWEFKQYFAEDPEARYIPKPGGTFTGPVNFEDDLIVKGDSTNGSGELTLNCENNSHGIKIKGPPHSAGANYTLTLPNDTGTNGQALTTNGSGALSFDDITSSIITSTDFAYKPTSNSITFNDPGNAAATSGTGFGFNTATGSSAFSYSRLNSSVVAIMNSLSIGDTVNISWLLTNGNTIAQNGLTVAAVASNTSVGAGVSIVTFSSTMYYAHASCTSVTLTSSAIVNGVDAVTNNQVLKYKTATSKWTVDDEVSLSTVLPLTGGTLTGALTLSGNPTAANHAANKAYVDTEVAGIVSSAPATLDTLNELAAALGDDPNFATTTANSIGTKLPLAGGTLTGGLTGTSATFASRVIAGSTNFGGTAVVDYGLLAYNNSASQYATIVSRNMGDGPVFEGRNAASDLKIQLNANGSAEFSGNVTLNANLDMQDNDKILIGTGDDLEIYHDGTNSFVKSNTNELKLAGKTRIVNNANSETLALFTPNGAVDLYYDNSKKFETKTDGIDVTGEVQCDSLDVDGAADITGNVTLHANLDLQDNDKILLGTGDDLEIYHQGSNSFIDNNTGDLYIRAVGDDLILRATDDIYIQPQNGEAGIYVYANASVDLFYDGVHKLATKSDGVNIIGELECDSLEVSGTGQYTGAQRGSVGSHTLNGSISLNLNERNNYKFTLSGNGVLSNPSNQTAGQHGVIELVQDGTGGRTASFGSNWKFPGGTAPTLSTAANAQDLLAYYVAASGTIYAQLIVDLK